MYIPTKWIPENENDDEKLLEQKLEEKTARKLRAENWNIDSDEIVTNKSV